MGFLHGNGVLVDNSGELRSHASLRTVPTLPINDNDYVNLQMFNMPDEGKA